MCACRVTQGEGRAEKNTKLERGKRVAGRILASPTRERGPSQPEQIRKRRLVSKMNGSTKKGGRNPRSPLLGVVSEK